jgi:hypothetical protein
MYVEEVIRKGKESKSSENSKKRRVYEEIDKDEVERNGRQRSELQAEHTSE